MIKVEGLNKYYNKNKSNEIHVINDISMQLPDCGLVAFLGASGCGKTTLLNVIGGLDRGQGTILYDSFELKKYQMSKIDKFRNENFGYVFQTYNLLFNETVYDNLRIALELVEVYDKDEVERRIEYALKSVGMYKYRKKRANQLSGGQQQRVAIARALVKKCKIIIADEPTGNLDSANAVEVMNILKSISKKTLVLLVTHNEALANFYSDFIFRIEDGKIINQYENNSSYSLETVSDNTVYLKDMTLTENNFGKVGVKLYSNTEQDIQIEIIERNNTFYIKSNKTIKLLENSNLKLVDEHFKPIEKQENTNYEYDDSFFKNVTKKRNIWKDLWLGIKRSFQSFVNPTKKVRMIYTSLTLIGVLFAVCATSISNAIQVDTSSISADRNYYTFSNTSYFYFAEDGDKLRENVQNGNISSVQMVYTEYRDFTYRINFVEEIAYSNLYYSMYYNEKVNQIVLGRQPKYGEIAISSGLADELMEQYGEVFESKEELFKLSLRNDATKIVGIVENPYKMVYISEAQYIQNVTEYLDGFDDFVRYYEYEKRYDTYEIVAGRDLTEDDFNTAKILISETYPDYQEILGQDVPGMGEIVGVFRMKNVETRAEEYIIHTNYVEEKQDGYKYSYNVENYHLVEGREPENDGECLVSIYSSVGVGEKLDNGYKVVGRYNANTGLLRANTLYSTSAVSIDDYSTKFFLVHDEEGVWQSIEDTDLELKNTYDNEYDTLKMLNNETMTIFGILGTICLIATAIMVFFLMRSKMVNDIYNIGVYRSLGSSKWKIYLKYFCDTLVMVTLTALISYGVTLFLYFTSSSSINDFLGLTIFSSGILIPALGVGVLYLVNIVFGLLPIFTLLTKTPAEIMAKYDI